MSDDHTRDDDDETRGDDDAKQDEGKSTPAKPPTTVLGAILAGALEQIQGGISGVGVEGDGEGDATRGLQALAGRFLENMSRQRRERDVARAAEALARAEIGEDDDEDGADGGEVIDLAEAREARQSARSPVDLKAVVNQSVAEFVREHAPESSADEKVTIDGEFIARHGSELVRTLVSSVGAAWLGALTGSAEPAAADAEASEKKPSVDYDVLSILGGLLRSPAPAGDEKGDEASSDDDGDDAH